MPRHLHVLLVEDVPRDAELVVHELRRAGFAPQWRRIDTEADYLRALDDGPELVLSDFELPGFSGLRALELLRQRKQEIPFIIVSGTIGEDTAVDAMKQGATDYLLKDRLARLGRAVEQALEQYRLRREREQTLTALKESEERLRALGDNLPDSYIYQYQYDGGGTPRFVHLSAGVEKIHGVTVPEVLRDATVLRRQISPDQLVEIAKREEICLRTMADFEMELRLGTAGNPGRWLHVHSRPRRAASGEVWWDGVATDITARKKAEEASTLFRSLIERTNDEIYLVDPVSGRFLDANQGACRSLGYTREELQALAVFQVAVGIDRTVFDQSDEAMRKTGHVTREVTHRRKDGTEYPADVSLSIVTFDRDYLVAIVRDVTARKLAEQELRESEARYSAIFHRSPLGLVLTSATTGAIEDVNHTFAEIHGYAREELIGHSSTEMRLWVNPADREAMVKQLRAEGYCRDREIKARRKNGDVRDLLISVERVELNGRQYQLGTASDITERKSLEAQFLRAQRLEAIGTLSSGIAHDLNNILSPILMATGLLRDSITEPRNRELMELLESSARRGAGIIRQLLMFSRGVEGQRVKVQVRHLVKEMAEIARETFPRGIKVTVNCAAELWPVVADPTQLHQVLMNLCVNARDAMPDGGVLVVAADNVHRTTEDVLHQPGARPGAFVRLTVRDTGQGIPQELMHRIFEPFFTTKSLGQGTGLGLSTVLGIVRSHGGFVTVDSEPACGATFSVYVPAALEAVEEAPASQRVAPMLGNGETILVVDDEASIVTATRHCLEEHGYRVLTASDGAEAFGTYVANLQDIKVVVTDVMMPVMDGLKLARTLRQVDANIRVIASSGVNAAVKATDLEDGCIGEFLSKPYECGALLAAIRRQLNARHS